MVEVYAEHYGYASSATPAANRQAILDAYAATPTDGTLILRADNAIVDARRLNIDAIRIDRSITVRIFGRIVSNKHCNNVQADLELNPSFLFDVRADNVSFEGTGIVSGDGSFNDQNYGEEGGIRTPGLVYVRANNFKWTGLTIDTPPKIGIYLDLCNNARINGVFMGGPIVYNEGVGEHPDHPGDPAYTFPHTGYFAIRIGGGKGHHIRSRFEADAGGGKFVTCIMGGGISGGATDVTVEQCHATAWEKLFYCYGDHNRIIDNHIIDMPRTDAVRIIGSYNLISRNKAENIRGLTTIFNGHDNEISHNICEKIGDSAVNVQRLGSYSGGFSNTRILSNIFHADTASAQRQSGIGIYLEGTEISYGIDVNDNVVTGFAPAAGMALIRLRALPTASIARARVNGNRLSNGYYGILFDRASRYEARCNDFDSINTPVFTQNSAVGVFTDNRGLGSIVMPGIAGGNFSGDTMHHNQWDDNPLEFLMTLPKDATSISMSRSGITSSARLTADAANDAARLSTGANGIIRVSHTAGTVMLAHTGGNPATSDELYLVRVSQ